MKLKHKAVLLKLSQLNCNWRLMPWTEQHLAGVPQRGPSDANPVSETSQSARCMPFPRFDLTLIVCCWRSFRPESLLLPTADLIIACTECIAPFHRLLLFAVFSVAFSAAVSQDGLRCSSVGERRSRTTFTRFITQMLYIYLNEKSIFTSDTSASAPRLRSVPRPRSPPSQRDAIGDTLGI